ncbi:hypothetical protein CAFE_20700 [Caprobacter fermentans]|uniref:Uncharacterized protein n=1 Tax=Caproicibacter fermentans TaxID=2576756 RepID=A0A6N8HZU7_9FIRM|nr:hypothetical protein [Caproicibacter fermentans]MVB11356.1 hypothetical protein [Caproicibacter fermentans]
MREYPVELDSKGQMAAMHLSDRLKRKWLKRRGDEFIVPCADVQQMCVEAGHPEYFNSLRNRIYRAMEVDHSLMECVMVDLFQPDAIRLPEKGVAAFRDILTSYFNEEDIDALHEYLHDQTELKQCEYSMRQNIRALSSPELKKCVSEWNKMVNENRLDRVAADRLKSMVSQELKERKRIF